VKPLTAKPWPQMRELIVRVGQNGILRVGSNGYSVPSGLKGKRATVRIYEWHIEVWYANQRIETLPRVPGANHYQINYRHVIDSTSTGSVTTCYANPVDFATIAIVKTFSRRMSSAGLGRRSTRNCHPAKQT